MNKFLLACLFPCAVFAQSKEQGFSIKGNIKGLKDSTLVYLVEGANGSTIAQDYSYGGKFQLSGKLDVSDVYQVNFIGYKDAVEVFMSNDKIAVNGTATQLKSAAVTGSQYHADYELYKKQFDPLKEKLNEIVTKINRTPQGPQRDSLIQQFEKTKQQVVDKVTAYVKAKPASPVSTFILYVVNPVLAGPDDLEARYTSLKGDARKGIYAQAIEKMIADSKKTVPGSVGSEAVDFTQPDTAGNPVALSSFRGKYVLVDFWASWCRPCRMENPHVVAAYNEFKNKNFTVLGVSLDRPDGKANWLQAIHDDKLAWTHVSDLQFWQNAAAQLYGIQSIPANILIDPNGKIIGKDLRGDALVQKLKSVLK